MKKTFSITLLGAALLLGNLNTFADGDVPGDSKISLNVNVGANIISDSIAEWNVGMRFDVSLGYFVLPNLSVGVETGWIWNELGNVRGINVYLYQIPILATVVYYIPLQNEHWKPYLGAGIGGVSSVELIDDEYDDTAASFDLGYQFKAGVAYIINQQWFVDFGYKFMGVSSDYALYNHSLLASFTFNF